MRGDGTPIGPVYNGLQGGNAANGEFLVSFSGYTRPTNEFQLIVKALIVQMDAQLRTPIVMFRDFRANDIVLTILEGGVPLSTSQIKNLPLMIEISLYEKG